MQHATKVTRLRHEHPALTYAHAAKPDKSHGLTMLVRSHEAVSRTQYRSVDLTSAFESAGRMSSRPD